MNFLFKYILLICLLALFFCGCTLKETHFPEEEQSPAQKEQVTPQPIETKSPKIDNLKQAYYIHTVRWDGETLSLIAKWYIGKYKSWKLLARHNPEINPNNIHAGDKVWIPKKNMKTSKQMPKTFLNKYNKKKAGKQAEKTKTKQPVELYGPKEHEEKTDEYDYDL